ncbi:MAG TPA: GNAT family N-acetyltransferase [Acidimicrobiia bacterium]
MSDVAPGATTLPDGAVVRPAEARDLEALCALVADRGVPEDAIDLQLVVETDEYGIAGTALVEMDGQVVATATLLGETIVAGDTELPIGQIELVAARAEYEHRGYVRALMQWCHERSAYEEHVAQVMIGIPYFYRQFGYVYAIPMHPYAPLVAMPEADPAIDVRVASESDIPEMAGLQERIQAPFDLYMPHSDDTWAWLVAREGTVQLVATRRHEIVGCARTTPFVGNEPMLVAEIASREADAVAAILATAAGPDAARDTLVEVRPGVPGLDPYLGAPQRADWYYVRIPDVATLLAALRPELERRLERSDFATSDRTVEISFWESQLAFPIANARVGPITTGGPRQVVVADGGSGLPPDAVAHLVFGCGAAGLEDRFPDCYLGGQRELMEVLFPPRHADLLTFYLPS